MGKATAGFAAGVALTCFVFFAFYGLAPPSSEQPRDVASIASSATDPVRDISPSSQPSTAVDEARSALSSASVASGTGLPEDLTQFAMQNDFSGEDARDLLRDWTNQELRAMEQRTQSIAARSQEILEAERVLALVGGELRRRERIAGWEAEPPPDRPIQLAPEFSSLLENPIANDRHERIQREPIDSTWSYPMEANLQKFFTSRSQISSTFGTPTISCRTSACEVAFVAYGIDAAARAANRGTPNAIPELVVGTDFREATEDFLDQPWADEFFPDTPSVSIQDDVAAIIWHLYRVED
jgi:hypothetical protein